MERTDVRLTNDEVTGLGRFGLQDYVLTGRKPVDFGDVVRAEVLTSRFDRESMGGVREFAQEMFVSLDRTKRSGQEVLGIDLDDRDGAVADIVGCIRRVLGERKKVGVEVPEGCVLGNVTRTERGSLWVSPVDGGKSYHVELEPGMPLFKGGESVIIRPEGVNPLKCSHVKIPARFVKIV